MVASMQLFFLWQEANDSILGQELNLKKKSFLTAFFAKWTTFWILAACEL
jgi:hypothetical protein